MNVTAAEVVRDLAWSSSEPTAVNDDGEAPDRLLFVVPEGGRVQEVDLTRHQPHPKRKTGRVHLADAESFVRYVNTHGQPGTTVFCSQDASRLTAVLNAHTSTDPGWEDHEAVLVLTHTPAWLAFTGIDGKLLPQEEFAEFVQDQLAMFVNPASAAMLEIAHTFEAKTSVDFESAVRLDSGQRNLVYKETVAARAGQKGNVEIPETVTLALAPWRGGDPYMVTARLRYRIVGGNLALGFKLDRVEEVLDRAFHEVVDHVNAEIFVEGLLVVHGTRKQ